jgi:iron complex outermembrane recepter protein
MKKIIILLLLFTATSIFAQEENGKTEELKEVTLVGSRSVKRTVVNSAVPIDIINIKDVTTQSGKIEINQLLQYVAPSFNATKQSGSDGSDHVDPASLRGLGPDQTLVLINGKRRHQSSLVNIFGTRGRGNTGTDLNAIPATSIKRIEILRDGAAAQYGSDAIAGVINIVLNDNINELTGAITYGVNETRAQGDYLSGTANTPGFRLDEKGNGNTIGADKKFDGNSLKAGVNYGVKLGSKGGFANFTGEYFNKEKTLRPGFDFRKGFGEAGIKSANIMVNLSLPVTDKIDFYGFGGFSNRDTDAYAFTRNSGPRVVESIYPGGYTPRITSNIKDFSGAVGFKMKTTNGWKIDLSNAYGKNIFDYTIKGTINASLESNSPKQFKAGGYSLSQNTTNLDFTRSFKPSGFEGFNIAFGAELRLENYQIMAGEVGSYALYSSAGEVVTNPATQFANLVPNPDYDSSIPVSDDNPLQVPRPSGSQGFPGFSPKNVLSEGRTSKSLYIDTELDVTKDFMLSTALRYENYSDFGSTLNWKFAYRLKLDDHINVRSSFSTGFRAPSLAQIYFNTNFTNFTNAGAIEVLLAQNESVVTKGFGIEKLKEEKSINGSIGFTANFKKFTASIDGYLMNIRDRIVLTDYFDASALNLNVNKAQFFVNGVGTRTTGLDLVLSFKETFNKSKISATIAGNINKLEIVNIQNKNLDQATFFGKREIAFLKASAPESKFGLNLNYSYSKFFDAGVAFTRFSAVTLVDYAGDDNYYGNKIVTDATLGFQLVKQLKLSIGANNLLNIYPDKQNENGNTEAGGYYDAVQMGFSGAYYFARLGFNF